MTDVGSYGLLDPAVGNTPAAELDSFINNIVEKLDRYGIVAKPTRRRQSDEARKSASAAGKDFAEVFALIQEKKK